MLLNFAMTCLIGSLAVGLFGFEGNASAFPAAVLWARLLFVPLLGIAAAAFVGGTIGLDRQRLARRCPGLTQEQP